MTLMAESTDRENETEEKKKKISSSDSVLAPEVNFLIFVTRAFSHLSLWKKGFSNSLNVRSERVVLVLKMTHSV